MSRLHAILPLLSDNPPCCPVGIPQDRSPILTEKFISAGGRMWELGVLMCLPTNRTFPLFKSELSPIAKEIGYRLVYGGYEDDWMQDLADAIEAEKFNPTHDKPAT